MSTLDNKNIEFGKKIKQIRNEKRFTVRQAAYQGGLSNSYWSQVETGKRNIPKPETLEKMAKGLRISRDDILEMAGLSSNENHPFDPPIPDWANGQDKIDLEKFLDENLDSMTYGGEDLTEEEKAKVRGAMIGIFWDRHKHD